MSSRTSRRQKRQERSRRQGTAPGVGPAGATAAEPKISQSSKTSRKSPALRSTRWMLLAAIVTTIAACADAALLAVTDGSDRWLYGVGLVLWVCLAAYHWNRWISVRRRR